LGRLRGFAGLLCEANSPLISDNEVELQVLTQISTGEDQLIFEGFYLDGRVPLGGGFDCELSASRLDFYHRQVKTTRRKLTIFRVAISNRRILALEDGQVTFSYKDSATDQTRFSTIPAEEFIRRFLQNVLPKGFVKVRYYGLLAASNRHLLDQARQLLTTAASHSNSSDSDCQRKDTGEPPCWPQVRSGLEAR
jgi:Putative transposase